MKFPAITLPFRGASMKGFRLGIREKTALVVMAVAVGVTLGTAYLLQEVSARLVEQHELVDLDDEAHLRAWDIIEPFSQLREDLRTVSADEEIQILVYEGQDSDSMHALSQRCEELSEGWERYVAVQIVDPRKDGPPVDVLQRVKGVDPQISQELIRLAERSPGGNVVQASRIHRLEAELAVPPTNPTAWIKKWMPVVVACARVEPINGMNPRYLVFTMYMKPPSSSRHLFFLVDNETQKLDYVVHPNMAIQQGFGQEQMFAIDIKEKLAASRDAMVTSEHDRIRRIAQLNSVPLTKANRFFFREGRPRAELEAKLDELRKADPKKFDLFRSNLTGSEEGTDRQVGGLATRISEVRLLTNDPADLDDRKRSKPNFRQIVESEIRQFTGLPKHVRLIDWDDIVICTRCHISCVELFLDTSEGRRSYLLLFAAFHEEFVGSINQGIRSGLFGWVFIFGAAALVIAFVAAIIFIHPLQQMTETAQHVVAEQGVLHEKLKDLSATLPTERRDEVGDIARASKRLFDEVVTNHEQLESRVRERTIDLEKANEQLESLGKEKDAFLANVSHELRTPLTAVSGFLQLLKRRALGEREMNYVVKALHGAGHLEALIDDILDFQKIIMGGITLIPDEFDVEQLLTELSEAMQFQANKYQNKLKITLDPSLKTLNTDRQRLRQVLTNLLSNACKFTKDGVVEVQARPFERGGVQNVRFRVVDSGRGMTPEEQKRLFTRFHTTKKANESGTGLGLVISLELCKLMGGRLFLESSGPGKGSVFTIEMPQTLPKQPPAG